MADRARLGASDGQLGERGDGAGAPRAAAGPRARGRDRQRPIPFRPGRPGVPVRQGQDGAARSRRRVPGGRHRPAPAAPEHQPRDLLGSHRLGGRTSRRARRAAPPADAGRGSAVSRLLGGEPVGPGLARASALRARRHGAALARPRGLPHALRRRARAAGRRRRSLCDHERRRRDRAAHRRGAARGGRAGARLHPGRRRLGEGRRLQHDVLAHRAAAADARQRPLHDTAAAAGRRSCLPAASRRLRDVSHALRRAGPAGPGADAGDGRRRSTDEIVFATASRPAARGAARHAAPDSPLSRRHGAGAVGRGRLPPTRRPATASRSPSRPRRRGLDFTHEGPTLDPKLAHIMPQVASMGAGLAIVDVDADGHADLYVTNSKEGSKNRLYRNKGDGTFEDIAERVGLAGAQRAGHRRLDGQRLGRLRQRRLRGRASSTSGASRSCSTTTAARPSRDQRPRRPAAVGQHQRRDLVRLRSRRQARSVPRRLLRRAGEPLEARQTRR